MERDLFCRLEPGTLVFTRDEFERPYRMSRFVYKRIWDEVVEHYAFFMQRCDATGNPGGTTHLKLFAVFLMFTEGRSV